MTHHVWHLPSDSHLGETPHFDEAMRLIHTHPRATACALRLVITTGPNGYKRWDWHDGPQPDAGIVYQIIRPAEGMSGLCSRHRDGEDASCLVCYPYVGS